jgi:hypothetical protein
MRVGVLVVLGLGALAGLSAACDGSSSGVRLVSQASFVGPSGLAAPSARFAPNPIPFSPILGFGCPGGAFTFNPSFHLIVTAGVRDLTLDHVTMRMLDGSDLGPSITIPRSGFAAEGSSEFVQAGTTREFGVSPNLGCVTSQPLALDGHAFLFDSQGMTVALPVDSRIAR